VRAAVVRAVPVCHLLADELEIHCRLDLAQQVVFGHEFLERHHLEFVLGERRFLQHDAH
jgi:hypothetical protein